jgi:glycosyltransferase involved in cell wall biosynthesis
MAHAVFRRSDRLVVQNRSAAEKLAPIVAPRPVLFQPHPSEAEAPPVPRDAARSRLGLPLDAPIFLFTGILRPYKGWDLLLEAFPRVLEAVPNALLVFAGEPWGDASAAFETARANVRAELRYLSAEERGLYLDAASAVVCPYRHATGSGIAADALAHGRPVIGTRVDGLTDVLSDGVDALLVSEGDVDSLADSMIRFVKDDLEPVLSRGAAASSARFSPDEHARALLRFARS